MTVLATIWALFKFLILLSLSLGFIVTVFVLLHPLDFDIQGRCTFRGQRGEIWFSHFFGLLGIGVMAGPRRQTLKIRIWRWKMPISILIYPFVLLFQAVLVVCNMIARIMKSIKTACSKFLSIIVPGRKPPEPSSDGPSAPPLKIIDVVKPPLEPSKEFPIKKQTPDLRSPEEKESSNEPSKPDAITKEQSETVSLLPPSQVSSTAPFSVPPESLITSAPAIKKDEVKQIESGEISSDRYSEESKKEPDGESSTPPEGFVNKYKEVRKKILRNWRKVKRIYRQSRGIWERFSPIIWKFVGNMWRSFRISGPGAKLLFGFPEPHVTGMFQGAASQVSGMLFPFGIFIKPEPVFDKTTLHIRFDVGARVYPWRVATSVVRLFFEKELWKGLYDLWKWYRSRSAH